jgi:hypothetical protein
MGRSTQSRLAAGLDKDLSEDVTTAIVHDEDEVEEGICKWKQWCGK